MPEIPEHLEPKMQHLRLESVLIQAFKKTTNYIRYHNWFSDALDLDWNTINLPEFIDNLSQDLRRPSKWESEPLRFVPAPKSQSWQVDKESGSWGPKCESEVSLRPLAHVSLRDQVAATAVMLCLANRVETKQHDPRLPINGSENREKISSYGNRLFCDERFGKLYHRWGSAKLYRAYFKDYQTFVSRPTRVAASLKGDGQRKFIIESDLKEFYDRVGPSHLAKGLQYCKDGNAESRFFNFARKVLDWRWHERDTCDVKAHAESNERGEFQQVILPQGLVSAGFFSNVVLLEFDEKVRGHFSKEIKRGIFLEDACRYVDDLRLVVTVTDQAGANKDDEVEETISNTVRDWIQEILTSEVPGLEVSKEKTRAVEYVGTDPQLILQSERIKRTQTAISGGFDAAGGLKIMDMIHGLIGSQLMLSHDRSDSVWHFSPLTDIPDQTVLRFSANRFRSTYRSIRPLLQAYDGSNHRGNSRSFKTTSSQQEVDVDARAFSLSLIDRWIENPSNVRLLRIGFDICPDPDVLQGVLDLLKAYTESGSQNLSKNPQCSEKDEEGPSAGEDREDQCRAKKDEQYEKERQVVWYCLSELLRAGATETGIVEDDEQLPSFSNLGKYQDILLKEAVRILGLLDPPIPWYVRQQAYLYLAAVNPLSVSLEEESLKNDAEGENKDYLHLIAFLKGESKGLCDSDFATLAVLSRRSYTGLNDAKELVLPKLTKEIKKEIAMRDPSFVLELGEDDSSFFHGFPKYIQKGLCREEGQEDREFRRLDHFVFDLRPDDYGFRNELSLLQFAGRLLKEFQKLDERGQLESIETIAPGQVLLKLIDDNESNEFEVRLEKVQVVPVTDSGGEEGPKVNFLYCRPSWCPPKESWRLFLGYLLKFILARRPDITESIYPAYRKQRCVPYRPVSSHWYQRLHGMFNRQAAFGDEMLPISDWVEKLLLALLHWPGVRPPSGFQWVDKDLDTAMRKIDLRVCELKQKKGSSTNVLMLPLVAAWPSSEGRRRALRACVVQTVLPRGKDLKLDPTASRCSTRRQHRDHLSAALSAVKQMLILRKSHTGHDRLDWLILPELAVHPDDVERHLVPFVRAHRTLILAGLTYQRLYPDQELVNSAVWVVPEWSEREAGLQITTRRQGKLHLDPDRKLLEFDANCLKAIRPNQWLVGFPWSAEFSNDPEQLWLSASLCYDATDLGLAADLRRESDVYAIPSFNMDVKTFDQMAMALNYHMYQLVVIANNGGYGGSNAYWPRHEEFKRQVFHLHGQPQASIAFIDIPDISEYQRRRRQDSPLVAQKPKPEWKQPPANLFS